MPIKKLIKEIENPGEGFAKIPVESMNVIFNKLNEVIQAFNSLEERAGKLEEYNKVLLGYINYDVKKE